MDFLAQIPLIGPFFSVIVPFVVVLGIVVAVHEYGHYIVGRWCGIHAEVFSLGFGKVLWSRTDKRGTRWQVAMLPIGGYVKFLGDADASSRPDQALLASMGDAERARSFPHASIGRRFLTVLAGPVFNFILSVVIFAGLIMVQGIADKPVIGSVAAVPGEALPFLEGDEVLSINGEPIIYFGDIRFAADRADPAVPMTIVVRRGEAEVTLQSPYLLLPVVGDLMPLSPAIKAGLERGDYILEANGTKMNTFFDLQTVMNEYESGPVALKVWRAGQVIDLTMVPGKSVRTNADGGFEERVMIGVVAGFAIEPMTESVAPWTALYYGAQRVVSVVGSSLSALQHIATGKIGADNLSGPIGIAQVSGEMATSGLFDFIGLIAFVSTAIGMLNLFPVPVLDGGHLVVFAYEAVRGRPPSPRSMEIAMSIGLALVLLLMLFATYNDIMRL